MAIGKLESVYGQWPLHGERQSDLTGYSPRGRNSDNCLARSASIGALGSEGSMAWLWLRCDAEERATMILAALKAGS